MRTTPWVREQWEREYGLEGLAGADYERHLDAVWSRLGVNDRCSELNPPQQRMQAGAEKLGWAFARPTATSTPSATRIDSAGFIGFGDQSGRQAVDRPRRSWPTPTSAVR